MKKANDTRALLIDQGLKALLTNGYDGAGLGAILDAAAVPKGSFYYFFKSKEEFALAVLDAYERHYVALREAILGDRSQSPMRRLRDYFETLERIHLSETPLGGCLYGVLAQTVSARSPEFRAKLVAVFATWDMQLQQLVAEAQASGEIDQGLDPNEVAAFLIEAYEGALIRMKVDGGSAAFDRFRRFAIGSLIS
jgi:TetR/AcrR family transcriptional repressor of nem operon